MPRPVAHLASLDLNLLVALRGFPAALGRAPHLYRTGWRSAPAPARAFTWADRARLGFHDPEQAHEPEAPCEILHKALPLKRHGRGGQRYNDPAVAAQIGAFCASSGR